MQHSLLPLAIVAIVALIGAVAGLLTGDMRADSALAGAVVGTIVGSWLSLRVVAHRQAIRQTRENPQAAARQKRLQESHTAKKELAKPGMGKEFDDLAALR